MLQPKSQVLQPAEPAFTAVDSPPRYLDRYVDLLSRDDPVPQKTLGLIYELLHRMRFKSAVELIDGESQEGQRLEGHLSFPALLARRSAVRVLPHQRIHNGFGEPVRVPGCVALTGSDAGNVPTKPAIKFPSISRSALAASLGSSGCLSSGAGLNLSTM